MSYTALPTLTAWKRDSRVTLAIRRRDHVLTRIDQLLGRYWGAGDACQKFVFLCDLFFAADAWLKIHPNNRKMDERRQPAVRALFDRVAEDLSAVFHCSINKLPQELAARWGRGLSSSGDQAGRVEAAKYRIWFRDGKAHMLPWYDSGAMSVQFERAESRWASVEADGYGFFALNASGDLYITPHDPGVAGAGRLQCSGTMLVEGGVVKRIRLGGLHQLSGFRALVVSLRMWGVALHQVVFEDFDGRPIGVKGSIMDVVKASPEPEPAYRCVFPAAVPSAWSAARVLRVSG